MALFRRKEKATTAGAADTAGGREPSKQFLPQRGQRRGIESLFVRLVATGGIIGIGTGVAAILGSQDVAYWIVGLAVTILSVILAAVLWSSRTL